MAAVTLRMDVTRDRTVVDYCLNFDSDPTGWTARKRDAVDRFYQQMDDAVDGGVSRVEAVQLVADVLSAAAVPVTVVDSVARDNQHRRL